MGAVIYLLYVSQKNKEEWKPLVCMPKIGMVILWVGYAALIRHGKWDNNDRCSI